MVPTMNANPNNHVDFETVLNNELSSLQTYINGWCERMFSVVKHRLPHDIPTVNIPSSSIIVPRAYPLFPERNFSWTDRTKQASCGRRTMRRGTSQRYSAYKRLGRQRKVATTQPESPSTIFPNRSLDKASDRVFPIVQSIGVQSEPTDIEHQSPEGLETVSSQKGIEAPIVSSEISIDNNDSTTVTQHSASVFATESVPISAESLIESAVSLAESSQNSCNLPQHTIRSPPIAQEPPRATAANVATSISGPSVTAACFIGSATTSSIEQTINELLDRTLAPIAGDHQSINTNSSPQLEASSTLDTVSCNPTITNVVGSQPVPPDITSLWANNRQFLLPQFRPCISSASVMQNYGDGPVIGDVCCVEDDVLSATSAVETASPDFVEKTAMSRMMGEAAMTMKSHNSEVALQETELGSGYHEQCGVAATSMALSSSREENSPTTTEGHSGHSFATDTCCVADASMALSSSREENSPTTTEGHSGHSFADGVPMSIQKVAPSLLEIIRNATRYSPESGMCKDCGYYFTQLRSHIFYNHRPFPCPQCHCRCKNKWNLNRHIKTMHNWVQANNSSPSGNEFAAYANPPNDFIGDMHRSVQAENDSPNSNQSSANSSESVVQASYENVTWNFSPNAIVNAASRLFSQEEDDDISVIQHVTNLN